MRINTTYSKWSVLMITVAMLSLVIINYLFFSGEGIFFEEPFLWNVYLIFIIGVEVFFNNRILKVVSYLLTVGLCGCVFIYTLFFALTIFIILSISGEWLAILCVVLILCSGMLLFSAGVSLLKLYAGE